MNKLWIFSILAIVILATIVVAKPDFISAQSKGGASVTIPAHAVEVSNGVYYLGQAIDNGRVVEGYAFTLRKNNYAKPGTVCGNGICEQGENANKCSADCGGSSQDPVDSSCYSLMGNGVKWKSSESYVVNPSNVYGIAANFIISNIANDIQKFEDASSNILGSGSSTNQVLSLDTTSTDGINEIYFGSIDEPGVIAITSVWGIWRGPPHSREIVEFDQIYDQVDYAWDTNGSLFAMDFENIATHELGHALGLDHPDSSCTEETMYAYADFGETKKRSLESGDVAGINQLYI